MKDWVAAELTNWPPAMAVTAVFWKPSILEPEAVLPGADDREGRGQGRGEGDARLREGFLQAAVGEVEEVGGAGGADRAAGGADLVVLAVEVDVQVEADLLEEVLADQEEAG